MAEAILNPTPDQTFRIEGRGDYDFSRTLRLSDEARGAVRWTKPATSVSTPSSTSPI